MKFKDLESDVKTYEGFYRLKKSSQKLSPYYRNALEELAENSVQTILKYYQTERILEYYRAGKKLPLNYDEQFRVTDICYDDPDDFLKVAYSYARYKIQSVYDENITTFEEEENLEFISVFPIAFYHIYKFIDSNLKTLEDSNLKTLESEAC